jgi:cytochrome c peroxidase
VRHHLDPLGSLASYDGDPELPPSLRATIRRDAATLEDLARNVADSRPLRPLGDDDVEALVAFLTALTNASELAREPDDGVPASVPSGLPVPRWIGPHPFR